MVKEKLMDAMHLFAEFKVSLALIKMKIYFYIRIRSLKKEKKLFLNQNQKYLFIFNKILDNSLLCKKLDLFIPVLLVFLWVQAFWGI